MLKILFHFLVKQETLLSLSRYYFWAVNNSRLYWNFYAVSIYEKYFLILSKLQLSNSDRQHSAMLEMKTVNKIFSGSLSVFE